MPELRVDTSGDCPYIMLQATQAAEVCSMLERRGVSYWADEDVIAVDGGPEMTFINISRNHRDPDDILAIQKYLDSRFNGAVDRMDEAKGNALADLSGFLEEDEAVEAVVFGPWGWGNVPHEGEDWTPGFGEQEDYPPVPYDVRGKLLTPETAFAYMDGWSFDGGSTECYATCIWTNKRVIWSTATGLDSMPRNPVDIMPHMPGGERFRYC